MQTNATIVVTGAAGFIGSALTGFLNEHGFDKLILVDEFATIQKVPNLGSKNFIAKIEREEFFDWLANEKPVIDFIFHLGARTDTTEFDYSIHQHLNVDYSIRICEYCTAFNIPLIYASSAATYGDGSKGFDDDHSTTGQLEPLNAYGVSKNEFDKWILGQHNQPPFWAGLKFFNVFGPNEYHKGRMASVIFHSFNQIKQDGLVKLFKSHRPDFADGQQLRDFIYVKDVLKVCFWLMQNQPASAIYNLGTGTARSFADLVKATFGGLDLPANISYIDMPEDIRDKYQYFTEAKMEKLRAVGYKESFYSLEQGVDEYVRNFLKDGSYY